jgi:hypothetical protein
VNAAVPLASAKPSGAAGLGVEGGGDRLALDGAEPPARPRQVVGVEHVAIVEGGVAEARLGDEQPAPEAVPGARGQGQAGGARGRRGDRGGRPRIVAAGRRDRDAVDDHLLVQPGPRVGADRRAGPPAPRRGGGGGDRRAGGRPVGERQRRRGRRHGGHARRADREVGAGQLADRRGQQRRIEDDAGARAAATVGRDHRGVDPVDAVGVRAGRDLDRDAAGGRGDGERGLAAGAPAAAPGGAQRGRQRLPRLGQPRRARGQRDHHLDDRARRGAGAAAHAPAPEPQLRLAAVGDHPRQPRLGGRDQRGGVRRIARVQGELGQRRQPRVDVQAGDRERRAGLHDVGVGGHGHVERAGADDRAEAAAVLARAADAHERFEVAAELGRPAGHECSLAVVDTAQMFT